jgi:hypothetical protein
MTVQSGPEGARVVCAEAVANSGKSWFTCLNLQLLPPAGAAVAAAAPLAIDCSTCTGHGAHYTEYYVCCRNAHVMAPTETCPNNDGAASNNTELHCGPRAYCYDPGTFYNAESKACAELTAPPTPTPAEQCQNSINKHCTPAAVAAAVQRKDTGEGCLPQSETPAYSCISTAVR